MRLHRTASHKDANQIIAAYVFSSRRTLLPIQYGLDRPGCAPTYVRRSDYADGASQPIIMHHGYCGTERWRSFVADKNANFLIMEDHVRISPSIVVV